MDTKGIETPQLHHSCHAPLTSPPRLTDILEAGTVTVYSLVENQSSSYSAVPVWVAQPEVGVAEAPPAASVRYYRADNKSQFERKFHRIKVELVKVPFLSAL